MAATRVNGYVKETAMTTTSKCNCCPYGFHIDLGFVDFVENIASESGTGMTTNDRSGHKKNSLKCINTKNGTKIKYSSTANIEKAPFSPLNSIFSDSLENVVSDFDEALNLRENSSERGSRNPSNNEQKNIRCNGYSSDYDTTQIKNRPLPPRIHMASSSRRLLFAPEVQYGYRTALGRAISEIKSKHQNDEINDNFRKTLFTANDSRVQDISNIKSRSYDVDLSQEQSEYNRSLYEQGKAHFLGSRTPDMPRRSFTFVPSQNQYPIDTESIYQPQWRIRSSVEQPSSTVNVDRFTSMRRRKADENTFRMNSKPIATLPIPYPRNCSLFSERLRRDHNSPPHLSLNSPPHLSLNFSTTEKYLTRRDLSDVKTTTRTCARNTSNGVIENDFVQLTNGDRLAVGSKDSNNDVNVKGLCFRCYNLQKQLSDLSCRLKEVTEEIKSRTAKEELRKKREVIEKSVGDSYEMFDDVVAEMIKTEEEDAANDAPLTEVENKRTCVSLEDRVEMQWCDNIASSPRPEPPQYSIEVATDNKLLTFSLSQDATIDLPNQELLTVKPVCHVECGTEPVLTKDYGCGSYVFAVMCDSSSMTDTIKLVDSGAGCKQTISLLKDSSSMTAPITSRSRHIQTEHIETRTMSISTSPVHLLDRSANTSEIIRKDSFTICDQLMIYDAVDAITEMDVDFIDGKGIGKNICCDTVALQTEFESEQNEPRIISDTEIAESLWLIPSRDRKDVAVGNEDDVIEEFENTLTPESNKLQRELMADSDGDDDTICVVEETLSDPEDVNLESSKSAEQLPSKQRADSLDVETTNEVVTELKVPRTLGHARAAIVKKMLTEKSQPLSFIRGKMTSKSWRSNSKKGDSLQYIVDQHKIQSNSTSSIPQTTKGVLKEKVNLKKDVGTPQIPLSKVPEPVPARIPRPKISKYIAGETIPQSPDEEAEIADRLTPLRSEMRTLRTYSNERTVVFSRPAQSLKNSSPRMSFPIYNKTSDPIIIEDSSSSDSEGSYDTNEAGAAVQFELTPQLSEAIEILKKYIQKSDSVEPVLLDWATKHAKHEWLKIAARKTASAIQVEGFIDFLEEVSDAVLKFVINFADPNENTALHYAISHGNFDVVSVLLDSRVCNLDRANKAGYTAVMLASLCDAFDEVEAAVIHRLFQLGNVNAQAVQHGQTALMLAVSHGKINTTKLLIDCQADLNIQDEEGSTALMCAAEHGHKEIVKLLLAQQDIDASLSDCDSSTALSIAVENGHRDIGVLIYAHLNHSCKQNQQKIESSS